jgi:hypothetical protein
VDTASVSNVDDVVNPHFKDGDELTIPHEGIDDEQVLDDAIPRKKPSKPMVPDPQVPKQLNRKLSPLFYVHFVSSQSSAGGRLRMRMICFLILYDIFISIVRRRNIEL